jgi:Icc-related predicted phosphoesterase
MSLRLVLISDTHCYEPEIREEGDVLVHAGDFLLSGSRAEAEKAAKWFAREAKKFSHAVCIAGNHDWFFSKLGETGTETFFAQYGDNIHYLENTSVNLDGKNFYGSPMTPTFFDWAFMADRGKPIREYWDMIPDAGLVDVVLTHGPGMGILDQASPRYGTENCGCEDLAKQITISQPQLHVFGHIHGSSGTRRVGPTMYVNASLVDEAYRLVNLPKVFEI